MQKATPQECLPNLCMIPALLPLRYGTREKVQTWLIV